MTLYQELATPAEMSDDCVAVERNLSLQSPLVSPLGYDRYRPDAKKQPIEISEAATRLANALHLHLD